MVWKAEGSHADREIVLRVSVQQTKPGMVLAHSVYHPIRPDITLLKPGAVLDRFAIPRLLELGVHEIWIRYPGLEPLMKFANPRVLDAYRGLLVKVGSALNRAMLDSSATMDYHAFRSAMMKLIDEIVDDPGSGMLVGELIQAGQPFVRHAGNTCLISMLMGIKLDHYLIRERGRLQGQNAKDVAGLAVGAMFHDIGLLRIEPEALSAWLQTKDEMNPAWREHVKLGHEMVHEHFDASAAAVVLHHHQRFDGSGFHARRGADGSTVPLRGSEIHVFARIAAVADEFDRLRFPAFAPGEKDGNSEVTGVPTVRALAMMRKMGQLGVFDPVVVHALELVVPPFAPGSLVQLSDGRFGAVVEWNAKHPCWPKVAVFQGRSLWDEEEVEEVDLGSQAALWQDFKQCGAKWKRSEMLDGGGPLHIVRAEGHDVRGDVMASLESARNDRGREASRDAGGGGDGGMGGREGRGTLEKWMGRGLG